MAHDGIDLWAYWRYMRARGLAMTTIRPRFAVAVDWTARHPEPGAAGYRDVEAWIRDRAVSASSSRALLVNLRALYHWLQREGLAGADPTAQVDRARIPARLPRPTPDRDVARLLDGANVPLRALLALMACAGLRCVECSRLDWCDVDLAAGRVIVNGKGQRERSIDLSADVVGALAALRLAGGRRAGPVFVGASGRRLQPWRVSQLVNRAIHDAGYSSTAHQLRHRCATAALIQADGDLLAVRDLLGHATVATTQIYAQCIPGRTAATSRALNFPRNAA